MRNTKGERPFQFGFDLPFGYTDSLASPSGRFMIYYDAMSTTADSNATLAFAQQAALEADSAYAFEIEDLGYTPPEFTTQSHYNIYLAPLHSGDHAYGETYTLANGQLSNSPSGNERWKTFTLVDNQFADSHVYATLGYDALRITIFHEFFHTTQFSGYGVPPSNIPNYVYFQEMSSTWMEWLSTPRVKDYLQYVGSYLSHLDLRFDLPIDVGQYGEYLYFAYLTKRFQDTAIVKKIWELYRDSSTDPMVCIEQALEDHGSNFCSEYEEFGWELMQSGWRNGLHGFIPDAAHLPIGLIPFHPVRWDFTTVALSLQFASKADCFDTCIVAIARDTDRAFQSSGSVDFPDINSEPVLTTDSPAAYCYRKASFGSPEVTGIGVEVFPDPFVSTGSDSVFLEASAASEQPVSTVLNIMTLMQSEVRSEKLIPFLVQGVGCQPSWFATWDGRDDNGKLVPSGEYLYTLHVDGALKAGKIVVVRK